MSKIAVTYERYSTDKQNEDSLDDQHRANLALIRKEGWTFQADYRDAAISGSVLDRPGLQQMLADAQAGKFKVIVATALDRLSRSLADSSTIYRDLQFAGVSIWTASEGEMDEARLGLLAIMASQQLRNLASKTRDGLAGKIARGLSAGGVGYGYRVDETRNNPEARGGRGHLVIDPEEAAIVQRIFTEYAEGRSPRAICSSLNAEGIPPPRGGSKRAVGQAIWSSSTLNGNRERGTGILNNELYVGSRVWNKLTYVKAPKTGRRQARINDASMVHRAEMPTLRLVPDELWQAVKDRQAALDRKLAEHREPGDKKGKGVAHTRRPRHLLSGLLRCGVCGGGFSIVGGDKLGCSKRKEDKNQCSNNEIIAYHAIEIQVLENLVQDLATPSNLQRLQKQLNGRLADKVAAYESKSKRLEEVIREKDRALYEMMNAIEKMGYSEALAGRVRELEAQKAAAQRERQTLAAPHQIDLSNLDVPADMGVVYAMLETEQGRAALRDVLERLLTHVEVAPPSWNLAVDGHDAWAVVLHGNLPALDAHWAEMDTMAEEMEEGLTDEQRAEMQAYHEACAAEEAAWDAKDAPAREAAQAKHAKHLKRQESVKMVAGVGFEPTTFRL